jgi:leader peptidase (prepilin peptidase)/N-methyltransferase
MTPPVVFIAAILGACLGSFCNVVIVRMNEGTSLGGRSRCVKCHHTLRNAHLIPILSWIFLRGRCAFCRAPIHWQYPAVELAGSAIAVASLLGALQPSGSIQWSAALFSAVFMFVLLVITAFDLRWQLVPVEIAVGAGVLLGVWRVVEGGMGTFIPTLLSAAVTSGILCLSGCRAVAQWGKGIRRSGF